MVFDDRPGSSASRSRQKQDRSERVRAASPRRPGEPASVKYEGVLDKVKDGTSIDDQDEAVPVPGPDAVRGWTRPQLTKDAKNGRVPAYYSRCPSRLRGETVKILALFLQSTRSGSTARRAG